MLEYQIRGENITATQAIEDYIHTRLDKLENYIETSNNPIAHVNIRKYNEKTFKIEVTIPLNYITLRAEETQSDFYLAVDLVADKLARQIRKYKTRVNRKSREKGYKGIDFADIDLIFPEEDAEQELEIVRRKTLSPKPMDVQEAILQMEMLQHTFFVFRNMDTDQLDVVYKRKDGKYGLIEADAVQTA